MERRNDWLWILVASTILLFSVITVEGQPRPLAGPNAQLQSFTPNEGDVLTKGVPLTVKAKVSLIPSATESIEFTERLTVKKRRLHRYVTTLTPCTSAGCVTGNESPIWRIRVRGPKRISIRLQLTGLGKSSGKQFNFSDVTRTYSVQCNPKELWMLKRLHHFLGCCLD